MGGSALDLLAGYIERAIGRLLKPVTTTPLFVTLYFETSEDGLNVQKWVEDKSEGNALNDPRDLMSELNNAEVANQRYLERQKADDRGDAGLAGYFARRRSGDGHRAPA